MARAKPTRFVESDEDDSDGGHVPAKRKADLEDANRAGKRARTASAKQKQLDKENLDILQTDVQRAERALQKTKKKAANAQAAATAEAAAREAEYESEERMEDNKDNDIRIPNRIMALPIIAPPVDKTVKLKSIKRAAIQHPKAKRFIALPRTSSPAPTSGNTSSAGAAASNRHEHDKGRMPAFCDGFIAGLKPKASDYAPTEKAVILRSCQEYTMRLLTIDPFPSTIQQAQWAKASFKAACRAARERFQFTDRIGNVIRQRGPSSRGKIIENTRSLFASEYKMVRSTSALQIAANKAESERLLVNAAFHYKDTKKRAGYAEHPIIKAVRQLTVFKDTDAVGVIFASAFNPIPFSLIALEMTAIEVCVKEWQTGQFVQSKFAEKAVSSLYSTNLIDVEKWSAVSPTVVGNLRRHWYTKLTGTLVNTTTTTAGPSNIDDEQEAALRAELEGRTGDTDSEPEAEEEGAGA